LRMDDDAIAADTGLLCGGCVHLLLKLPNGERYGCRVVMVGTGPD
jgi:hypothetical protein